MPDYKAAMRVFYTTLSIVGLIILAALAFNVGKVNAQPAESVQNIPVGACFENGQCWNGRFWYKKVEPPKPHVTKTWKITGTDNTWVIETTGVCIYEFIWAGGASIATVPKTQLPVGAGCE
jgi:hypothetical protein